MKDYYIVLTDKKHGWEKIFGRRQTTIEEINDQARWVWSLFNRWEQRRYRVMVQGEIHGELAFDSDVRQ